MDKLIANVRVMDGAYPSRLFEGWRSDSFKGVTLGDATRRRWVDACLVGVLSPDEFEAQQKLPVDTVISLYPTEVSKFPGQDTGDRVLRFLNACYERSNSLSRREGAEYIKIYSEVRDILQREDMDLVQLCEVARCLAETAISRRRQNGEMFPGVEGDILWDVQTYLASIVMLAPFLTDSLREELNPYVNELFQWVSHEPSDLGAPALSPYQLFL